MQTVEGRIPGHDPESATPRPPFGGKRRVVNAVEVRFDRTRARAIFDAGELVVRSGDLLVVDAGKGLQIASAVGIVQRRILPVADIRRVIRRATERDQAQAAEALALADQALRFAVQRSRRMNLDLKLVHAEFTLDLQKAFLYFSSERRIDFRGLSRDIANQFRVRVDLRQIFVREGTGMVGGLGPCGQELCCSTFLTRFAQVSMRHAKQQGLALNPQRINGMCGRLKCCLVYEDDAYREMRKYAPRRRMGVRTPDGLGNIEDIDAINRTVRVVLHGGVRSSWSLDEVIVLDRTLSPEDMAEGISREDEVLTRRRMRRGGTSDSRSGRAEHHAALNEEYLWDDATADIVDPSTVASVGDGAAGPTDEADAEERRGRRRRRKKPGGGAPQGPGPSEPRAAEAGGSERRSSPPRAAASGAEPSTGPRDGDRKKRSRGRKRADGSAGPSAATAGPPNRPTADGGPNPTAAPAAASDAGSGGGGAEGSTDDGAARRRRRGRRGGSGRRRGDEGGEGGSSGGGGDGGSSGGGSSGGGDS